MPDTQTLTGLSATTQSLSGLLPDTEPTLFSTSTLFGLDVLFRPTGVVLAGLTPGTETLSGLSAGAETSAGETADIALFPSDDGDLYPSDDGDLYPAGGPALVGL